MCSQHLQDGGQNHTYYSAQARPHPQTFSSPERQQHKTEQPLFTTDFISLHGIPWGGRFQLLESFSTRTQILLFKAAVSTLEPALRSLPALQMRTVLVRGTERRLKGREVQGRSTSPRVWGPRKQFCTLSALKEPQVARDIPEHIPLGHSQNCPWGLIRVQEVKGKRLQPSWLCSCDTQLLSNLPCFVSKAKKGCIWPRQSIYPSFCLFISLSFSLDFYLFILIKPVCACVSVWGRP